MQKLRKVFYGWWMVLASAIMNLLSGASFFYGFTVFFNPIRETFNWTAAQTSLAFTFQRLESGLMGPVAGLLVDRLGPRKLMMLGWSAFGLGFILMSHISSLWSFYVNFIIVSIGLSFGSFIVVNTAIAHWFVKKRSRALTMTYVGFGLSGMLVPLVSLAVQEFGWRSTLFWLGVIMWATGILFSLVFRHKPEPYGYLPDGELRQAGDAAPEKTTQQNASSSAGLTVRETLRTPAFWFLSIASIFQFMGIAALSVHVVPYLESVGIEHTLAALVVSGITVCSLIGRLGFGLLGDYQNKKYLITICVILQTAGLLAFAFINADMKWLIILFLLTYGPGYGGPIPLRPGLQADYFGTKSYGTVMGLMSLISMVGGLVSPVFAGWIYDTTGSYQTAWFWLAGLTFPAVILYLLASPPRSAEKS